MEEGRRQRRNVVVKVKEMALKSIKTRDERKGELECTGRDERRGVSE